MSIPRDEMVCENCIYWYHTGEPPHIGQCRAKHPVLFKADTGETFTEFPVTASHWWCGDGVWERYSEITEDIQSYGYDNIDLTFEERVALSQVDEEGTLEECLTS